MVTGAISGADILTVTNGATTWSSSKDGVTVSYYDTGDTSLISKETWKGSDGGTRTITISVGKTQGDDNGPHSETVTFEAGGEKLVHSGTALTFSNPSM